MTVCTDYSINNAQIGGATFPLSGANSVHAYVNVDKQYQFQVRCNNDNPKHRSIEFKFDTPGSENPRQTTLTMEVATDPKYFARIALVSPLKTASIEAGLNNNDKEMVFYADVNNDDIKFNGKLGFTKAGSADHQEFTPILVWNTPSSSQDQFFGYKVNGKVIVDKRSPTARRYNFNKIEIVGSDQPITVNGWVDVDGDKYSNDLQISRGNHNGKFLGKYLM